MLGYEKSGAPAECADCNVPLDARGRFGEESFKAIDCTDKLYCVQDSQTDRKKYAHNLNLNQPVQNCTNEYAYGWVQKRYTLKYNSLQQRKF